jgi:hypothetical protein
MRSLRPERTRAPCDPTSAIDKILLGGMIVTFGQSVSIVLATTLLAADAFAAEPSWEEIIDEQGIVVEKRAIPGSSLVEFRGRGAISAPLIRVAAVLRNSGREQEWMESCIEARVLEWRSPTDATIYNRTQSPAFFISDRDLVAEARTTILYEEQTLLIEFRSVEHKNAPALNGVVRMPDVRGHWKLRRIDANTTELEYRLGADPGGALPKWLVNWATERIPFNTIANLRVQAKKSGYEHDERILALAIDFSRFEVEGDREILGRAEKPRRP